MSSHGFQSLLLLFQPSESLFVELFPYNYYIPTYFGDIQLSLRFYLLNVNKEYSHNYNIHLHTYIVPTYVQAYIHRKGVCICTVILFGYILMYRMYVCTYE
jgi:hypothetical protein